jgi:alcohol dehydrogenase class IV
MATIASLQMSTEILFGSGCAVDWVGARARQLGAGRVLLVSDQGLARVGIVEQAEGWLKSADLDVATYADVEPEPSVDGAALCVTLARQAEPDVVVGIGGGSVLDTAKVVAMLLRNPGGIEDYLGVDKVSQRGVPLVLMPTTSGTGAESTRNALFYVPARRTKEAVISSLILPSLAVIDPTLTISVPPAVTAATGIDALSHAIEAYTGLNSNPLTDAYALEAIRLIAMNLRMAVYSGQNLSAREGMALASFYAGVAIAFAGTNGVHALAYPLQGLHRIAHGVANSVLLPSVMAYNVPANLERFARVAQQLGEPINHLSLREAAESGVRACRQLSADIGIPQHLSKLGIAADQVGDLVVGAMQVTRLLRNNPRPLLAQDAEQIFRQAL